jgi:hypothetical protein
VAWRSQRGNGWTEGARSLGAEGSKSREGKKERGSAGGRDGSERPGTRGARMGSSGVRMGSSRVGMARSEEIDANVLVLFGNVVLLGRRPRCVFFCPDGTDACTVSLPFF